MRNSQEIANLIKETAKAQKKPVGKMLSECGLSVNALSSMQSGGYYPRLEAITKIADYLGVSVDYLLGRTETPEIDPANKLQAEFFKIFQKLPFEEQVNLMNIAIQKAG